MKVVMEYKVTMIYDTATEDNFQFLIEDHICHDNYIQALYDEIEEADTNHCACYRGEAKFLRVATPEDIENLTRK